MPPQPSAQDNPVAAAFDAVLNNDPVRLEQVLAGSNATLAGPLNGWRDAQGRSLSTLAAELGRTFVLQTLRRHGVDLAAPDGEGSTPWHEVAETGDLRTARLLVHVLGCEALETRNAHGETPLQIAAMVGHARLVTLLAEAGADTRVTSRVGDTPLHLAAWAGQTAAVSALLARNVPVDATNNVGETALSLAAKEGHVQVARALLGGGADPLRQDVNGNAPVHHAAWGNQAGVVDLMIDGGTDMRATNRLGASVARVAAHALGIEVLQTLVRHGVPVPAMPKDWDCSDPQQLRCLMGAQHAVAEVAREELVQAGSPYDAIAKQLHCPLSGKLFSMFGTRRPVRLPDNVGGAVVCADAVKAHVATQPYPRDPASQAATDTFLRSEEFRQGDAERLQLVGDVLEAYIQGGGDAASRPERARLWVETGFAPPWIQAMARHPGASAGGGKKGLAHNAPSL